MNPKPNLRPLGPVTTRMMKLRKLEVSIANGSDPDVIELEDCTEVYGDWPEIDTPCEHPDAPAGQCHFNAVGLEPDRCLYCKKLTA